MTPITDDKMIEAALDAWFAAEKWHKAKVLPYPERMRAALAAADKVRAEGFDLNALGARIEQWDRMEMPGQPMMMHMGTSYLVNDLWRACQKAFAAGLAKGEANRAAPETELERERIRLAACGGIANANTPETAAKMREMNSDYWSASAADVANAVDREMALRADRSALVEALKPFAWFASLLPKSVPDYMPLKADLSGSGDLTVAHLRAAALALVRKGE